MKIELVGKKKGKPFKKKFKSEIKYFDLSCRKLDEIDLTGLENCPYLVSLWLTKNKLTFIDLNPLSNNKTLLSVHLEKNPLKKIDLYPLVNCDKLTRVALDRDVKISWSSEELDESSLPSGLKPYLKQIKESRKLFTDQREEERAHVRIEEAPERITELLNQFRPGIHVPLKRIADLAEVTEEYSKRVILEIIKTMPEVGEFLELEQIFIRKIEADIEIDKLLKKFEEWGKKGEGKRN